MSTDPVPSREAERQSRVEIVSGYDIEQVGDAVRLAGTASAPQELWKDRDREEAAWIRGRDDTLTLFQDNLGMAHTFIDSESLAEELDRRAAKADQKWKPRGACNADFNFYQGEALALREAARLVREGE